MAGRRFVGGLGGIGRTRDRFQLLVWWVRECLIKPVDPATRLLFIRCALTIIRYWQLRQIKLVEAENTNNGRHF